MSAQQGTKGDMERQNRLFSAERFRRRGKFAVQNLVYRKTDFFKKPYWIWRVLFNEVAGTYSYHINDGTNDGYEVEAEGNLTRQR
jgi:hypothetical protein